MLRIVEHYTSVQGEGPKTGVLTQFVRFAGCNMRCPGWPCDTEHAINPAIYGPNSERMNPEVLSDRILNEHERTNAKNICFTGGEPFLQKHGELESLIKHISEQAYSLEYEFFTNGSFIFPEWSLDDDYQITFMLDWKLKGSGEANTNVENRIANAHDLGPYDGIKFVVTGLDDLNEARATYHDIVANFGANPLPTFWVASAWDRFPTDQIVHYIIKNQLPWRLNVQVHKYIWPADKKGV